MYLHTHTHTYACVYICMSALVYWHPHVYWYVSLIIITWTYTDRLTIKGSWVFSTIWRVVLNWFCLCSIFGQRSKETLLISCNFFRDLPPQLNSPREAESRPPSQCTAPSIFSSMLFTAIPPAHYANRWANFSCSPLNNFRSSQSALAWAGAARPPSAIWGHKTNWLAWWWVITMQIISNPHILFRLSRVCFSPCLVGIVNTFSLFFWFWL